MSDLKIITEPSVYVIGRQTVDTGELARFLGSEGAAGWTTDAPSAAETLIEAGGRLCYGAWHKPRPGGNSSYIRHILEAGHGSVVEHAVWSIIITGISRTLTHELVRQRVGISPSQRSQRFVDEGDCAFVVPPALLPHHSDWAEWLEENRGYKAVIGDWNSGLKPCPRAKLFEAWVQTIRSARDDYRRLAESLEGEGGIDLPGGGKTMTTARRKAAREAARSVLPGCTATAIMISANGRALRHMVEMRGSKDADAEFRRLCLALLPILQREAPNLFGDIEVREDPGTGPVVYSPNRKV